MKELTIEEFREIKDRLNNIVQEGVNTINYDSMLEEEITSLENKFIHRYVTIEKELLSYDLSKIPFEEWSNMVIISEKYQILDFSKTKANIDFSMIEFLYYDDYEQSEIIFKQYNLNGCNLKNLEHLNNFQITFFDFDKKTKDKYPNIFLKDLSDQFSKELVNIIYLNNMVLLPPDEKDNNGKLVGNRSIYNLNDSQIKELDEKGYIKRMLKYVKPQVYDIIGIEKILLVGKILEKEAYQFYDMVNLDENFLYKIRSIDNNSLSTVIFDYIKNMLINNNNYKIVIDNLPIRFLNDNRIFLLLDENIPDDVKKRYYDKNLSIEDIVKYKDTFKNLNIDNFLNGDIEYITYFLNKNYGTNKMNYLINKYSLFFEYLKEENILYSASNLLKECHDAETCIIRLAKDIFLNYIKKNQLLENNIAIPDWLNQFNFNILNKINTIDELMLCNENTIVLDNVQYDVIEAFGIENIKLLEKNIGYFSRNLNIFEQIKNTEERNNNYKYNYYLEKSELILNEFKNGSLNYADFEREFAKYLNKMRKNNQFAFSENYNWIKGDFRDKYPEIFIDDNAPLYLKNKFYSNTIRLYDIIYNPEYIKYLVDKNLADILPVIKMKVERFEKYKDEKNFISEYTLRYGNENFFNLILKYGMLLSYITISNLNNEIDDEQILEKSIRNKIYNEIINSGANYSILQNNDNMIEEYPDIFLDKDAPEELKEVFYSKHITQEFILSHPDYIKYLENINIAVIFEYMPLSINDVDGFLNLITIIRNVFGNKDSFDFMIIYGKYIEKIYKLNFFQDFKYKQNMTKMELLNEIDRQILNSILDGKIKYDENIPNHFKNNNLHLFINTDTPKEIKDKFYNREFSVQDFIDNPNLFDYFENTNIACGFPLECSWIISLFDNFSLKKSNINRIKIINEYLKIKDDVLENEFKEYIIKYQDNLDMEKVKYIGEILHSLSISNSTEMYNLRKELAHEIISTDNPVEVFDKIEKMFIKNNIPTVGKLYSCFEILHPDFEDFNFESSTISPVLKKSSTMARKVIVFSDLLKASFGSNNKSVDDYIKNIEYGSFMFDKLKSSEVKFDSLSEMDKKKIILFRNHLATLYNNTLEAKKNNIIFEYSDDIIKDILDIALKISPNGSLDYNIGDRVIRMFCGFTGINTLNEAKEYISDKIKYADARNRSNGNKDMVLNKGDIIKGIGDIKYLGNILQNGSVSKEYLGACAGSDATPLDTDVSMILSDTGDIITKKNATAAKSYGPIWFVIKNDDRFITTRDSNETKNGRNVKEKMELFYTGVIGQDHYGIRTGFASSEIDYILMEEYDRRVGFEIVKNGFYIPVVNMDGKVVFTPKDYDNLRSKMSGLSYFDENYFNLSNNLYSDEVEELASQVEYSQMEAAVKRSKITNIIKKSLDELGLTLKTYIDGDLTEGIVEFVDTGSTGRGTNKPGDGDFDFIMKLDRNIISALDKLDKLKNIILKNLGTEELSSDEKTYDGDFRLKNVKIDDETVVDIDITFVNKTNSVLYSTDMALRDRLATIKSLYPDKYNYVIANILLAKKVLKEGNVYKPIRSDSTQCGLGGVGVENWVLQNGGSFIDAATSFVNAAEGKNYEEFKKIYQIWDFGDNHLAERKGDYPHDEFIYSNMSKEGYDKMNLVLKKYLNNLKYGYNNDISRN